MSELASPSMPKVLLATDFSESARKAAEVAVAEARMRGARLYVLHVVRSSAQAAAGSADVGGLATSLGTEVPAVPATSVGSAAAEIVRYADEQDIDLVVIGGHGRTGVTPALLGSVAERVARTATRPVLVVPYDRHDAARPPAPAPHRCIVCGIASDDLVCEPCRANIRAAGAASFWEAHELGFVGELDREHCEQVLRTELIGRLVCHADGRLYVVPMAFAYEGGAVYLRSGEGTKVRMMREDPSVCLQVDHIVDLATWRSVIVWGTFHELHGPEASEGLSKIMQRLHAWAGQIDGRPAPSYRDLDNASGRRALGAGREAVVGRIDVTEMTGRYQQR
jgi:nucleotide-binding universal stress UspA family protein/nitroimidazol reductase NimA-like FMN-containing flavoprotein (pyridoxamine 5'-phosphate oxidase superfamily)